MNKKVNILILPMDDRPCTYDFPEQIGQIYGANIIIPPKNLLGNLEQVADRQKLKEWIKNNSHNLDGMLIASDTLAYGGLIPSRRNYESFEQIAENLKIIKEIKNDNKNLPVYVCSTILRISNSNVNQEEKEYWENYGELLYKYSYLLDKNYLINEGEYDQYITEKIINSEINNEELIKLKSLIPLNILEDYITGRLRNFRVNKLLLKWLKEEYIDFLVICVDDSSQYGFNVLEKRILNKIVDNNHNLKNKVNIYPGTDEAMSGLLARMINKINDFVPKFYPVYSQSSKSGQIITMYEGIPLKDTFNSQVKAVGGVIVRTSEEADITIYLHTSETTQEDQYLNAIYKNPTRQVSQEAIQTDINNILSEKNDNIALIDLAFANGGDNNFMAKLSSEFDLTKLITYSAWNTAGNSIGVALAHSCIRFITKNNENVNTEKKHYEFLFDRLFDDWLYQGFVRLDFIKRNGFPLSQEQLKIMAEEMKVVINNFINEKLLFCNFNEIKINDISFPWKRPFEIDIKSSIN